MISGETDLSLIPSPVEIKVSNSLFELTAYTSLSYTDPNSEAVAQLLAKQLRPATGYPFLVQPGDAGDVVFCMIEDETLGDEGYTLTVAEQIVISAQTPAGLFYGAQTLRQLLPPNIYSASKISADWTLPVVEIRDRPRFSWRGLHLDVARHFMPKEDVLRFIDMMASLKLNILHWHLTEDQGWRIEINKYPRLTEVGSIREETQVGHFQDEPRKYDGKPHGGFYTQDEIREVVDYAAARSITIVPEIDMPGHMQAAIAAYPELGCTDKPVGLRNEWGISEIILNPEESTIQFCQDVLTEVMDLFPSKFIHIGGDEALKNQWDASPRVQELLKERGLKDSHEMQSWFIKKMDDFLVANGRRLIGWDEIAEGGLAPNAAVMWWRGHNGLETAQIATENGHDLVVAAQKALYFDYYQSENKENEPLAIGGFLPLEKVYEFEPIIEGLSPAAAEHVLGAQGQLWTEYMPNIKHVEYMAFPRACALSEIVWLPREQRDYTDFKRRMQTQEKRFESAGVNYRKLD
ncbi:MAG TPA: beta-N-acetylhexosaminidase [Opitutae bacterium]|nr:beta-N-acetylhexosaminidase [Opitutae bacterium]